MGAEQSQTSDNPRPRPAEPTLPQREVQRLLNAQRQMYEKKCQEYMEKAQNANSASTYSPQPASMPYAQQPTHTPQMQQATYTQQAPQMQPHYLQNPTQAGLERQRAPYSYTVNDLQNINRQTSSNLYPNLNANMNNRGANPTSPTVHSFNFNDYPSNQQQGFVFVNHNGQAERTLPSAPPPPRTGRDRSVSRTRNNNQNSELNCPTCKTMFGLQIYQCSSGHSSCKTCKEYRRSCGICKNNITDMRNIALEAYMAEKKVSCPHKNDGCMLFIKMADIEFHVKECPFKELDCPMKCGWKGKLKQLIGHFDALHPEQRKADVDTEVQIHNVCNNSQNLFLVLIGAYNFLFHVKVSEQDRKIYMSAQLIGTKMSATKWSYEVHIYNKNECRRKYTFTDVCRSFTEPIADVFTEGSCVVLPQAYASTFVNNGALTYKFFIKQTIESKPRGEFKKQRGKGRP